MSRFRNRLKHVRIAAPCPADWNAMIGNDRVRFCGSCNLNVYNLSDMTRADAETLIARTEGRLCVRYYKRSDGSVITNNCPVGLRKLRKRLSGFARAITSAAIGLCAGLAAVPFLNFLGLGEKAAFERPLVMGTIAMPPPTSEPSAMMGDVLPDRGPWKQQIGRVKSK